MCHPQDPLFQAIFSSGHPPFQALSQFQRPHFYLKQTNKQNKKKKTFLSPIFANFGLSLALETQILAKI